MSKKKRVTIKAKDSNKNKKHKAQVYTGTYKKRGVTYPCYFVRGWKVDGKWQRKQFSNLADAEAEAAEVNFNLKTESASRYLVNTTMSEEQVREAEEMCRKLGDVYTISEVIDYFLKHNRAPDFTIDILDGLEIYLEEKELSGMRGVSLRKPKGVLRAFARFVDNPHVGTVAKESVLSYLKALRANDGESPAKRKTWNNHRNELASFFKWAGLVDKTTNRPWIFHNPVDGVLRYKNKEVAEQRPPVSVSSVDTVRDVMSYAMSYKGGKMVKFFALVYFAGIRPDPVDGEISKVREINLDNGRIAVPPVASKTKTERPVTIMGNLRSWLEQYADQAIIPPNCKNDAAHIRHKFGLGQDETRHSFISYYVALYNSLAHAALQSGNSESMIHSHYLTHPTHEEGKNFFSIVPNMEKGEAVFSKQKFQEKSALKPDQR